MQFTFLLVGILIGLSSITVGILLGGMFQSVRTSSHTHKYENKVMTH